MWDLRQNPESGAVAKTILSQGFTVQDLEINKNHGKLLTICNTKVYSISLTTGDLSIDREFQMPTPMNFKEEGGASLSPDGKKFIAVSHSYYLIPLTILIGIVLLLLVLVLL